MKEKMIDLGNQSFWEEEEEQEQQQQQENQYANKEQLEQHENATKQEQLNESVMSQDELNESKVSQNFTEMEGEKISATKAQPVPEPTPVVMERKYKFIDGQEDKDYKNVMATWDYYEEKYGNSRVFREGKANEETSTIEGRITQLSAVETNASRYCRWKFGVFMNKKSAKYARYQQVYDMKEFAKKMIKELKKELKVSKQKIEFIHEDETYKKMQASYAKHSLPVKIISAITGSFAFGFYVLGRKLFGTQTDPHGGRDSLDSSEVIERHAEFLNSLFTKKISYAEQTRRMATDSHGFGDEEDEENLFIEHENMYHNEVTNIYHSLMDDQKALLKEYKAGRKNTEKIKALEESISRKTKEVSEHNDTMNNTKIYENVINTTDSDKLNEELDKYRK